MCVGVWVCERRGVRWIILEKAHLITSHEKGCLRINFLDLYFWCFEFIQLAPQGIIKSHVMVM